MWTSISLYFPAAVDHMHRHFDYLAMGDEGGLESSGRSSLPVTAAAAAGAGAGASASAAVAAAAAAAAAAGAAGATAGAAAEAAAAAAAHAQAAVTEGRARLQSALLSLGMTHAHFAHSTVRRCRWTPS